MYKNISTAKIELSLPDNRFFSRVFFLDDPLFLHPALGGDLFSVGSSATFVSSHSGVGVLVSQNVSDASAQLPKLERRDILKLEGSGIFGVLAVLYSRQAEFLSDRL